MGMLRVRPVVDVPAQMKRVGPQSRGGRLAEPHYTPTGAPMRLADVERFGEQIGPQVDYVRRIASCGPEFDMSNLGTVLPVQATGGKALEMVLLQKEKVDRLIVGGFERFLELDEKGAKRATHEGYLCLGRLQAKKLFDHLRSLRLGLGWVDLDDSAYEAIRGQISSDFWIGIGGGKFESYEETFSAPISTQPSKGGMIEIGPVTDRAVLVLSREINP